jgi:hypothetical protein
MATKRIDNSKRHFHIWFCLSWNGNGTMLVFSSSRPNLELDEPRETAFEQSFLFGADSAAPCSEFSD